MTDYTKLIERLREIAWQDEAHSSDLYDKAADAIEALQEENALLEGTLESRGRNIAEMQAENERLTYELQVIEENHFQLKKERDALQAKLDAMGKGSRWLIQSATP